VRTIRAGEALAAPGAQSRRAGFPWERLVAGVAVIAGVGFLVRWVLGKRRRAP